MSNLPPILGFRGIYEFMSNFHESRIWWKGKWWPTVEHAYQAAKNKGRNYRRNVRNAPTPGEAKKLGNNRSIKLRLDWEAVKIRIMLKLVRKKFKIPDLRAQLLLTGDAYLEETNWWNDRFWGVCKGEGQNWLGKILMIVRAEILEKRARRARAA